MPARAFTGMGWDAQSCSALLVGPRFRSALLLGLGGGTAARQLRLLSPGAEIVGVEIDAAILEAARAHFGIDDLRVRAVLGCGERYVRAARERFDFILDDMWDHEARRPRAIVHDPAWLAAVRRRLTPQGVYAVNIYARRMDPETYTAALNALRSAFAAVAEVCLPHECVTVLAGTDDAVAVRGVREALRSAPPAARSALRRVRVRDVTGTGPC